MMGVAGDTYNPHRLRVSISRSRKRESMVD